MFGSIQKLKLCQFKGSDNKQYIHFQQSPQMANIDVQKQIQSILKEGFLDKQSRFIKSWRSRWFVLTPQALMTFKERKVYTSPTEIIPLKTITSIKSADQQTGKQFSFRVDTDQASFFVLASSNSQKQQWIGQIGKAMVKLNSKMEE